MTADVVQLRTPLTVEAQLRTLLREGERLVDEDGMWMVREAGVKWPVCIAASHRSILAMLQKRERLSREGPGDEPTPWCETAPARADDTQ